MRFLHTVAAAVAVAGLATAAPQRLVSEQIRLSNAGSAPFEPGVGHFSEWSRQTKKEFLIDWQLGRMADWTLVQGNEAGDLDSMAAALTWAYHLEHSTFNTSHPMRAIALLQTPVDALDLRPENRVALDNSDMSSGHSDLLTIDELPEDPETLSRKIRGIVLVDHPAPLRKWKDAKILSIIDHHVDRGVAPDAEPRIFEAVASCTTLVARQMLDELGALPEEYHMPHELLEMVLSAIAIDSKGLRKDKATDADREVAKRILKRSKWHKRDLDDVMEDLDNELKKAKKDISALGLRDLLRRDWKGDLVDTPSKLVILRLKNDKSRLTQPKGLSTPTVSLGFASVPYSMDEQIQKTEFQALFDWFAIEAAWTAEIRTDISVTLTKYKVRDKHGKKQKIREIVLVVRDNVRIDEAQADSLFKTVRDAIEADEGLDVKPWHKADELRKRQMVWVQGKDSDAGRKVVRPLVEKAVKAWDMSQ